MRYYFSYGMNTNLEEMARRCPKAELMGQVSLSNYKFVFRHHADVEQCLGEEVIGVLWRITPECERALDALEGYPYYYEKREVVVTTFDGEEINGMTRFIAMVYYMTDQTTTSKPSLSYYDCLVQGYNANHISTCQLEHALDLIHD